MNTAVAAERYEIGDWQFWPDANELRAGQERRRLEHRAARTLELLCRRRGQIVSQGEIVREVWSGRTVSPNSVPVVISDLRQALGDDAREPLHIETLAKRGYRLLASPKPVETAPRPARRWLYGMLATLALIVLIGVGVARPWRTPPTPLVLPAVRNETGSPRYQPLAEATDALLMTRAQAFGGVEVFRQPPPRHADRAVTLDARLVVWNGRPAVTLAAERPGGAVFWVAMTRGGEAVIPGDVVRAMGDLGRRLENAPAPADRRP
ncbi:winged helix-turn-helix domain-containing protein [Caulobacter sp. 1776]|uniref:winged helix-turn-helix domain-containing protein n=1 Tax=Caulobacter sp. 1776 TaxID=3156420 RepID=UPI00339915DD